MNPWRPPGHRRTRLASSCCRVRPWHYMFSKPWLKPPLGSLIRKHFHDFRDHSLVALVAEPAEAPLVIAAQGMLQDVEKAFITVGARRVFGSGPSLLQQHRQVGVGK